MFTDYLWRISYCDFIPDPKPVDSSIANTVSEFKVEPLCKAAGAKTVLAVRFKCALRLSAGDLITLEFPTRSAWTHYYADTQYDAAFSDRLGYGGNPESQCNQSISTQDLECSEGRKNLISDSSRLRCFLKSGRGCVSDNQPAQISIVVEKSIPEGTSLEVFIADFLNPNQTQPFKYHVTLRLQQLCRPDGYYCSAMVAYTWFTLRESISPVPNLITTASLSYPNELVSFNFSLNNRIHKLQVNL